MANPASGRFSRTLFAVDQGDGGELERVTFDAARDEGLGVVLLRSGRDQGGMPHRVHLTFAKEGAHVEVRDCVLWAEDEGPVLIVPFDARENRHFAVGRDGIEERSGRPAAMLGRGMARAKIRLARAVRTMRSEDGGDQAGRRPVRTAA